MWIEGGGLERAARWPGAVEAGRWLAGWEDDPDEVRDQALRVRMVWRIERMACTWPGPGSVESPVPATDAEL